MALSTRKQITLVAGNNTVAHGLVVPSGQESKIMVIPLADLFAWSGVSVVGTPGATTVTLRATVAAVVNVWFRFPIANESCGAVDAYA